VLEIDSPFPAPAAAVCVSAAVALVTVIPPDRAASTSVVAPVAVNVPLTVMPTAARVMISVVPLIPISLPVNRTSSTSTYPFVLVMARPAVPEWVIAADV